MNYKDILAMASAYKQVAEKKTLDPVDAKELKGKHKDRKDKDIDNDGDVDKSDEYLHMRRKAVSASIKGKKKGTEVETEVQEMTKALKRALQGIKAQPKDKVSLKKAPWDKKETKESVEEVEELELDESWSWGVNSRTSHRHSRDARDYSRKADYAHDNAKLAVKGSPGHSKHMANYHSAIAKSIKSSYHAGDYGSSSEAKKVHKAHMAKAKEYRTSMKESVEELDEAPQPKWKVAIGNKHYTVTARNTMEADRKAKMLAKKDGNNGVGGKIERMAEEVELDEGRMLAPAFHRVIKAHKYESDASGKNHTFPHGDRSTKIKHNGTHVVTYNQYDGYKVHKTPASLNKHLNALHDHEVDMKSVQESVEVEESLGTALKKKMDKDAKKQADAMARIMARGGNIGGAGSGVTMKKVDKTKAIIKKRQANEEVDLSEFTQEEIIDFMVTEDFAQLDELSKKTLGSYVKKASKSASDNARTMRSSETDHNTWRATADKYVKRVKGMSKANDKLAKESVELDENRMLAPAFHRVIKAHKYESDASGKNHTWPHGDRTTKIKHNGTHVVTYNQHDGSQVHKTPASLNRHLNALHDHEVDMKSVQESKDHGNMNNGSPRGEGLSPSAKKELERTTPMNPATDELAVNNLNFKTFKAMVKKAPKRSADNDAGDKKAIASATSVKEELDLSDFTQEEIIDFMMTEDFAQLDELSKNTLSSYLKKAAKSKNSTIDKADRIKYSNAGTGSEMAPRSKKALDKHNKTIDKRTKGIGSFMKRDQAKANPEYIHKPSATDRYKDGSAPSMTNKPASALHKSYKDRK